MFSLFVFPILFVKGSLCDMCIIVYLLFYIHKIGFHTKQYVHVQQT